MAVALKNNKNGLSETRTNTSISNEANQRYRDDPGAQSYSGGFDKSTNNYNDPFDPGETE